MNTNTKNKASIALLSLILSMTIGVNAVNAQLDDIIPEGSDLSADTTEPSDVENVKAVAGDGSVTLSWDKATDNVGVIGYKIYYGTNPVTADSGTYTEGPLDTGDVLSYQVSGLNNGTTYYFVVTAYDQAGNESEYFSEEVKATPGVTDTISPTVTSAQAINNTSVKVIFSEAVDLPTSPQTAFTIKEDLSGIALNVISAVKDLSDNTQKTVILETAQQKAGISYVLTAGIQIKDKAGNPIVSGTSDMAVFTGGTSQELKPAAEEEKEIQQGPAITQVKSLNQTTVQITFDKPVVLSSDARINFIITAKNDQNKILAVKKVTANTEGNIVTLETDTQENITYNIIVTRVKDAQGNEIDFFNSATDFQGTVADNANENQEVTEALQNAASNLVAKVLENMVISLSWKKQEEKMAGIVNFVLYMSSDKGATYGEGIVLGTDVTSYTFNDLKENVVYYFKLTSKDAKGAESEALETFIAMTLPETGPGLLFLLFGAAGAGMVLNTKKKK